METTNKTGKKKILIFVPEFPVLSQTFISRDISKLIKLGRLDIVVLAMKKGSGAMPEIIKPHFTEARLTFWESLAALIFFITKPQKVYEAFKLVLRDKSKSIIGRKYLFFKSVGYARVFQRQHPDGIHAHFLSDPSTIAMVASVILGVPFSISAHARDVTEYPALLTEKVKRAKFIAVCNSNACNAILSFAGIAKSKVSLIRHGVDESDIFSSKVEIKKADRPMIISGGTRLVEKKGLRYLIEASKRLNDRGVSHEVHITGPGSLYEDLQKLIKVEGLEDTVFIHGEGKGVPFDLVSQYYRVADILVLPSISLETGDADGIPNVLIEASLAKLPIITTDAGSIPELVTDGFNGVVVPQKNSESITTEVEKLIFDEARRRELGGHAYKRAKEMFDADKNVGLLSELLLK